jgi:hypothetical protein
MEFRVLFGVLLRTSSKLSSNQSLQTVIELARSVEQKPILPRCCSAADREVLDSPDSRFCHQASAALRSTCMTWVNHRSLRTSIGHFTRSSLRCAPRLTPNLTLDYFGGPLLGTRSRLIILPSCLPHLPWIRLLNFKIKSMSNLREICTFVGPSSLLHDLTFI